MTHEQFHNWNVVRIWDRHVKTVAFGLTLIDAELFCRAVKKKIVIKKDDFTEDKFELVEYKPVRAGVPCEPLPN